MEIKEVKLSSLFREENVKNQIKLGVQVLEKVSSTENEYLVADDTAFCNLVLESSTPRQMNLIIPKNTIRIMDMRLDMKAKKIVTHERSIVFGINPMEKVVVPEGFKFNEDGLEFTRNITS